jgi:hypothetical protein
MSKAEYFNCCWLLFSPTKVNKLLCQRALAERRKKDSFKFALEKKKNECEERVPR